MSEQAWGKVINQIEVRGGTESQKRTFFTSLYHTYERMVDIIEGGKYYPAYCGKVYMSYRSFFVEDWIWDNYHAQHPLSTNPDPQVAEE